MRGPAGLLRFFEIYLLAYCFLISRWSRGFDAVRDAPLSKPAFFILCRRHSCIFEPR